MDVFTKKQRSRIMSKIRSKGTKAERQLKRMLKGKYLRANPKIFGSPDLGNKTRKIAVFMDGCFWHKCPVHYRPPKSNKKYWIPKIARNAERDREITKRLKKDGWKVVRIWEHDLKQGRLMENKLF